MFACLISNLRSKEMTQNTGLHTQVVMVDCKSKKNPPPTLTAIRNFPLYYMNTWKWDDNGKSLSRWPNADDPQITFNMTSGRSPMTSTIPRVECSKGHCTLGVRLAPNGSFIQELEYCLLQSGSWSANQKRATITREEAYIASSIMS